MKDKTTELFRDAPVPVAVIKNIIPSIISMIMVLIYNLADTYFIGQTKNPLMVAAVSVATPAFLFFMAVGMLFGIGGTSLISRLLGENKKDRAKNASSFCFWTGLVIGVIAIVLIWAFSEPLCIAIGASEQTLGYTQEYLKTVSFGIPFLIMSNIYSNIIRAEGRAVIAMIGMIVGNLLNVILDPIMIIGLKWNVAGAACATVIGNLASALIYIIHLLSKNCILSIKLSDYQAGNGIAMGIFAIGIPASLNSILMSTSNVIANKLMGGYGDMAVAGLGVAMKVNMIAVMLLIGLGTGIQPLLGYCYGARNKKRYISVLKFSLGLAFCLSLIMTVICYCGAAPLVNAFLEDEAAFEYGMRFARIYIYSGPVLGILFVFVNAIQSTGAAIPALILSISRQGILYLPIIFIFNKVFHTPETVAGTQPVTDYFAVVLSFILFIMTYKKYFKNFE